MRRTLIPYLAAATVLVGASGTAMAGDTLNSAIGGGLGGAVGAAVGGSLGGQTGAVIGGGLGGAGGAVLANRFNDRHDERYDDRRYDDRYHRGPRGPRPDEDRWRRHWRR